MNIVGVRCNEKRVEQIDPMAESLFDLCVDRISLRKLARLHPRELRDRAVARKLSCSQITMFFPYVGERPIKRIIPFVDKTIYTGEYYGRQMAVGNWDQITTIEDILATGVKEFRIYYQNELWGWYRDIMFGQPLPGFSNTYSILFVTRWKAGEIRFAGHYQVWNIINNTRATIMGKYDESDDTLMNLPNFDEFCHNFVILRNIELKNVRKLLPAKTEGNKIENGLLTGYQEENYFRNPPRNVTLSEFQFM